MEKQRKDFKVLSIVILVLTILDFVAIVLELCISGLPQISSEEVGLSKEIIDVVVIISVVLTMVFLLPEIYLGIKGIKLANNPSIGGKAHLVWAVILMVLSCLSAVSLTVELVGKFSYSGLRDVAEQVLDVAIFACYFYYARKIANAK
jgi:hypothetical protein